MRCIAFHATSGERCDRLVGKTSSAQRLKLCPTHHKSSWLRFLASCTDNRNTLSRSEWTNQQEGTMEKRIEIALIVIGTLGQAIAAHDWALARQAWSILEPLHAMLFERDPLLAHVAKVLIEEDPLIYPHSESVN
jgi:hypothetical protein